MHSCCHSYPKTKESYSPRLVVCFLRAKKQVMRPEEKVYLSLPTKPWSHLCGFSHFSAHCTLATSIYLLPAHQALSLHRAFAHAISSTCPQPASPHSSCLDLDILPQRGCVCYLVYYLHTHTLTYECTHTCTYKHTRSSTGQEPT